MERIVCNKLVASVADHINPLQFSYKARRGFEDACLVLINLIALNHLDKSGSYVCCSCTFRPHLRQFNPNSCEKATGPR